MLIVFSGRPGTGTTIARLLAASLRATLLRIDSVEQVIRGGLGVKVGAAGYDVAMALTADNLALGGTVVADCVNPVAASRQGWRAAAERGKSAIYEIELICSDQAEHRRRVEARVSDIAGHVAPTWQSVQVHEYEPWVGPRLIIDTALVSPGEALAMIELHLDLKTTAPD